MTVARALVALAIGLSAQLPHAQTAGAPSDPSQALPAELRPMFPAGQLAGRARLSVWGFQVYDAALWVAPGFRASRFAEHTFALELSYLRRFASEDISKRSLAEISRQRHVQADQAATWERQLREVIPDVERGDRITGIHRPGEGATFIVNGKFRKTLQDPEFSRLFFGIWLSESTSEPSMRRELLAYVPP